MVNKESIVQIIPAIGWWGHFATKEGSFFLPLVCWAVIEEKCDRTVIGMVANNFGDVEKCGAGLTGYFTTSQKEEYVQEVQERTGKT